MSQKSIRFLSYIVKGGIFVLPFLALIVAGNLFFPFITGKNFFFRIMVELLFFFWVLLAVFDKKYRPRKSPVLLAFLITVFFLTLAAIFGENPYRSFWSNYERMEGLVSYLHLFAYFLILTSTFRRKKDFKVLFGSMIGVSFIVTVYGFLQYFGKLAIHQSQTRLGATFGNATYLAIFVIFNLFLISLFIFWYRNFWLRLGLGILFVLESIILFFTATRGAILAFLGGLFLFGLFMAVFSKNKKPRLIFAGLVFFVIFVVGLFVLVKDQPLIKENKVLGRFANISLSENTTESRLTIWHMSWKGFLEHPFLGWGQENYNLVFNKYFEPKLYKQEPWFDRAHNVFFDWMINAGAMGFAAYMSIFVSAIFMLWSGYKKKLCSLVEAAGASSLLAAYGFNNLLVFDNLTSSFMFFSVLAFIHFFWLQEEPVKKENKEIMKVKEIKGTSYLVVTCCFLLVIFSVYFVNVKPFLAAKHLLRALALGGSGAPVSEVVKEYDKVFSYNTFGTVESREQLAGFANTIAVNTNISQNDRKFVLDRAIEEMEKQVLRVPNDIRYRVFLGSLYTRTGQLDKAEGDLLIALDLSPKKQQIYFALTDVYLAAGQYQIAREMLEKAYNLDKTYIEAASNLFMIAILEKDQDYLRELKEEFLERFGIEVFVQKRLINAYFEVGDYEKVKELWLIFVEKEPKNVQYRLSLAATYLKLNEREKAINEIQKIMDFSPSFKEQGEYLISEIRAGRNP